MEARQNLGQKVVKGAAWTLLEKFCCQGVGFVVGMVLARLLTPNDYGTVALVTIFFTIANVLVDGGFGTALIQKKDADELDFNSVFYLSMTLALVAYGIMFFTAPFVAGFYKTPSLCILIRVASIAFFFNAMNSVQNAELLRKMLFHLSFRISLIVSVASAVTGIVLAYQGFGAWALVLATLVSGFVGCVARCLIIAWRPRLMFSMARLKPLFSYGWKMSVSALIDQVFVNLNGMLIGKFYTKSDLAFVDKGQILPKTLMNQVDDTLGRVSFPALVQLQNDRLALREAMRRMMRFSTFLVFPLMVGLAACSRSLIVLLFGEQWEPAVPYMMIACFSFALWPFHTINLKGIMAIGRSDIFLKLEIVKKTAKLIFILLFFRYGVLPFVAACAFALGPLSVIINSWPNRKLLDYTLKMQVLDVLPTVAVCLAECAAIFGVDVFLCHFFSSAQQTVPSLCVALFCQFLAGTAVFFTFAFFFHLQPTQEVKRIARSILERLGLGRLDD